jgi:tetratricopeptide (TPR) repeat protein
MMRGAIVLGLLVSLAPVAFAGNEEARAHYESGQTAYNLQDFATALKEFKAAYVEKHDPAFLFNIAQTQRQLGQYEAAAKSYRLYLANQPDTTSRDQVLRLIDQMDQAAREAHAKEPPTGTQPPSAIAPGPIAPAPAGTRAAPPAPIELVDRGKAMRLAGILTADIGIGVIAVGVVFAVLSKLAGDDAYRPSSGIYDYAADQRQTSYRNADIACFVVGGAAMVVGTTIWMLGRKRRTMPAHAGISAAGAALQVRF